MNLYSFTETPLLNAIKHLVMLFPGIEKVVALTFSLETKSVIGKYIDSGNDRINDLDIGTAIKEIEEFRLEASYYKWIKKTELPFEVKESRKTLQMNVFEELESNVLLLAYQNEFDSVNDVIIVYFNQDHSNFGLSDTKSLLTPDHKKIIGYILYNNINSFLRISKNDIEVLKSVNENTQLIIHKLNKTKEELIKTRNNYSNGVIDLCKSHLVELSGIYNKFDYSFADDTITKIRSYKGDFVELKSIIEKAVIFVNNLFFNSTQKEILLTEEYFNFEMEITLSAKISNEYTLNDKYAKTIQLLDKLESAARDVQARNLELTGNNVGNACTIPISAPAISDALKKHRNKIIYLFEKYNNKWTTIRSEFRPVKNILAPKNNLLDKTA